ncbi:Aldo/keto reductase [Dentipellis sp. KUC8613]|nr:Aldo/keto reductase [Dentipellis sp. KUC8613]
MSKSSLNVVLGTINFGAADQELTRVHDVKSVEAILDVFQQHGHTEVDTARTYGGGTSEEFLGQVDWRGRGLKLETKLFPVPVRELCLAGERIAFTEAPNPICSDIIHHTPEGLRTFLDRSLKALNADSVEIWYLHGPDRSVPYEVTLKAVNDLYKEGKFKRFGISNYMSWEVAEMVQICRANGWIQPTVYQGVYNAIHRSVEPELFPCLRKYGMSFYSFSPLANGFLLGRYHSVNDQVEAGSRFDPNKLSGKQASPDELLVPLSMLIHMFQRIWKEPFFKAVETIKAVTDKHNLTLAEVALRWISHHSLLKRELGDSVIIGVSKVEHIKQNLLDLEKGPLPDDVVNALDEAWSQVLPFASKYYF